MYVNLKKKEVDTLRDYELFFTDKTCVLWDIEYFKIYISRSRILYFVKKKW